MKMQDLCESPTSEILSHVATADRWLLQFVNRQFRAAVKRPDHGDPRRLRVLDDVLEYAVSNGGAGTVRFLFHKKSHVWETAVEKAASKGDLETVRLAVEHGCARAATMAALNGGHLDVADFLLRTFFCNKSEDRFFEEMFVASVNSRDTFEWTVSKMPSSLSVRDSTLTYLFLKACWDSGDLACVERLCDFFGKDRIASTVFATRSPPHFVFGKRVIPVSVLRYLESTFGYRMDLKRMSLLHNGIPFDDDLLNHVLETQGFDAMQAAAADNVRIYAFLVRKGLLPRADLATAAANLKYAYQLEVLMNLYPDLSEWTAEERLLEVDVMQVAFGTFFRLRSHEANFDFEIKCGNEVAYEALRAMGGRCTSDTLWRVLCVSDDVEHARSVWAAMDVQERARFRSTDSQAYLCAMDLGMLEFVTLELEAVDRLRETSLAYSGLRRRYYTVSLARFLLEHRIKDPSSVLTEAILCGHADVTEMVVKHCTCNDLRECVERFQSTSWFASRADLFHAISWAIVEKKSEEKRL